MRKTEKADLQELVLRCGGYDKITPEDWARWDRAHAEYQAQRRDVLAAELAASKELWKTSHGRQQQE